MRFLATQQEVRPAPLDAMCWTVGWNAGIVHWRRCHTGKMTAMHYQEFAPSAAAASFVKCYWYLEDPSLSQEAQRIVPDGRPELILNFGQPFQSFQQGTWQWQPEFFLAGQITAPLLLQANGPARIIGVRFHPHGAGQLMRMPMPEFNDSVVSLEDISQPLIRQLGPMRELRSLPEQIGALDAILQTFAGQQDLRLSHAVRRFERANGLFHCRRRRRDRSQPAPVRAPLSPANGNFPQTILPDAALPAGVSRTTNVAGPDWADALGVADPA